MTTGMEDDDFQVIMPDPIEGPAPPDLSTGDADDDQLLRRIAAMASLDQPRPWRHCLYVPDEESAQMIARPLVASGYWDAEIFAPAEAGGPYRVIAERPDVILTADLVRSTRELFTTIVCARLPREAGTDHPLSKAQLKVRDRRPHALSLPETVMVHAVPGRRPSRAD